MNENTAAFVIYLPQVFSDVNTQSLSRSIEEYAAKLFHSHIWQVMPITCSPIDEAPPTTLTAPSKSDCRLPRLSNSDLQSHDGYLAIGGFHEYSENIDDEWILVAFLFHLTTLLPGIIVSVTDDDGEFLLIECADFIPRWLKPETSENRIFITSGKLHIIPLPKSPADISLPLVSPTLQQSLDIIHHSSCDTVANDSIQESILNKIRPFVKDLSTDFLARIPNQQFEAQYEARVILDALPLSFLCRELELPDTLYHRTLACLPLPLALLLHEQPQFVSPITRAFIHGVGEVFGNDEDIKRNTPYHIPKQTGQSLPSIGNPSSPFSASLRVMSNVRFTRCLFAMLQFRTVETPHRWVRCAKLASTGNGVDEIGLQHAVDIGTKLTIGAELLRAEWVRRGKPRDAKSPQPAVQSDAPERMLVDEGNEMPGLRGSGESMNPNDILRERIDSLNTKYSLTHSDHPSPRALSLNESLHLLTTYLDQIQQAQLSQQVVLVRPDDTTAPSPGFTSQSEHVPLDVAFFPRDGLVRRLSGIDGWEVVGGESEEWMYLSQEKVDEMIAEEGLGNTSKQNDQKSRDRETITQSAMQKEESNLNELPAASHPSNLMSNLDSFLSAQSSFEGVDSPTSTEQSHKPPKPSRSAVEGVFSSMDESDRRAVLAWMADGDDDEDDETVQFDQLEREITRFVRDTTDMKDWVRNGAGVQTEGENESSSEMLSDDDSDDSDGSGEDDDEIVQTRQEMEKLMQEMEKELTLGMNQNENDADFDVTSLENLVEKNLKRSLKEQGASAGPARTLLNSMGRRK